MDPRSRTGKFEVQNRKVQGPKQEGPRSRTGRSKVQNRMVQCPRSGTEKWRDLLHMSNCLYISCVINM